MLAVIDNSHAEKCIRHQYGSHFYPLLTKTYKSLWEYDTENHTEKSNHTINTTETTLKSFTRDNHTEIFSLITLKFVCYCYYSYPLFSTFSVLLWILVWFSVPYKQWFCMLLLEVDKNDLLVPYTLFCMWSVNDSKQCSSNWLKLQKLHFLTQMAAKK